MSTRLQGCNTKLAAAHHAQKRGSGESWTGKEASHERELDGSTIAQSDSSPEASREREHQLREVEITKLTKPDDFEGSDSMQSEFKGARGEERSRSLRSWPRRSLQEYFDHRMGESTESHSC